MTDIRTLSRIVEISRRRLDAARLALSRADEAVRLAEAQVAACIAEAENQSAAKDRLKAEAEIAFIGSPQTAAAVSLLIENNAAHDQKSKQLWQEVADARAGLDDRRAAREAARVAYAKLERDFDARNGLADRLNRVAARQRESRLETMLADDRAAQPHKELGA